MKILVAVDLPEMSDTIIEQAEKLAGAMNASLWLLHITDPEPDFVGYEVGPQSVRDSLSENLREKHSQLQGISEGLRNKGLEATALLHPGSTVEAIVYESNKLEADMIIAGTHGRSAMYQLLVGSVSEGLIQKSKIPVLLVPTHDRDE